MKRKTKLLLSCLAAVVLLAGGAFTGCAVKSIAPGGAYSTYDQSVGQRLVQMDRAIVGTKSIVEDFLSWELKNRAVLPDRIKSFANNLRDEAPKALQSATRLRDIYAQSPSAATQNQAQAALEVLDQLLLELAAYR